ncbi:hypothetical protein, partial [Novilysobacter defluvii]
VGAAGGAGGGTTGGGAAGAAGAGAPTSAELGELRQLLHAWRQGEIERRSNPDQGDEEAGARELRMEEVFSVASLLQAEPPDVFARALAGAGSLGEVIREQLNDGSRRLGLDPEKV